MPGNNSKNYRIPLPEEDRKRLAGLLKEVPTEKIVRYDWQSEEGRVFIKEVRRLQIKGVPANWIAEALKLSTAAMNGAIGYWERNSKKRGPQKRVRTPRPLSSPTDKS